MFEAWEDLALNWLLLLHDDSIGEKVVFLSHHLMTGSGSSGSITYSIVSRSSGLTKLLFSVITDECWPAISLCLGCMCTIQNMLRLALGFKKRFEAAFGFRGENSSDGLT